MCQLVKDDSRGIVTLVLLAVKQNVKDDSRGIVTLVLLAVKQNVSACQGRFSGRRYTGTVGCNTKCQGRFSGRRYTGTVGCKTKCVSLSRTILGASLHWYCWL